MSTVKGKKTSNIKILLIWFFVVFVLGVFTKTGAFILTNGLLLAFNSFLFLCFFPLLTILIAAQLWKSKEWHRLIIFSLGALMSFVLYVSIFIFPDILMAFRFEFHIAAIFIFIIIGLLICGISSSIGKMIYIYLVFAICTIAPTLMSDYLPYLYSPPSIQKSDLPVLKEWILYSSNHPGYGDFYCNFRNWISHHLYEIISQDEEEKLIELKSNLLVVGYLQFRKADNMLMFYKNASVILPPGPGVLYSIDGSNPNKSSNEYVVEAKPYEKIKGNWYMSRKLLLGGPRADTQVTIPKALIDRSLSLDGLDPNDLLINESDKKLFSAER